MGSITSAAREAAQPFGGLRIVGATAVVQDAHPGALLGRVPDVLSDLQVVEFGAVGAFLAGLAWVSTPKRP